MKTIGIIGGMSWESTAVYYRLLNQEVGRRLGGLHSARVLMTSLDFEPIAAGQRAGDWDGLGRELAGAARVLERGGADMVLIATNTMHKVYDAVTEAVRVPVIHIGDVTALAVKRAGLDTVGLLGTRFTMEQEFLLSRLRGHGLDVLVPQEPDRREVHRVIFDELCKGDVLDASREYYLRTINALRSLGAQGIILGCTEIGLLVPPAQADIPLFDTTELHAMAAVDAALAG